MEGVLKEAKIWYDSSMNKQLTLSVYKDELAQVKTRKKEFLRQMDSIIPWGEWIGIIKPHYYKGERGNKPYDLETILRIHMLQNLYDLSDTSPCLKSLHKRKKGGILEQGAKNAAKVPNQ